MDVPDDFERPAPVDPGFMRAGPVEQARDDELPDQTERPNSIEEA